MESRQLSPIIGLKSFNNWVKSVLIGKFTRPGFPQPNRRDKPQGVVLDLGCGKGGDLQKWNVARIQHYMGFGESTTLGREERDEHEALNSPCLFVLPHQTSPTSPSRKLGNEHKTSAHRASASSSTSSTASLFVTSSSSLDASTLTFVSSSCPSTGTHLQNHP